MFLITSNTSSTFSSSTPINNVVLPELKNPPVDANFVEEKPFSLKDEIICLHPHFLPLQL